MINRETNESRVEKKKGGGGQRGGQRQRQRQTDGQKYRDIDTGTYTERQSGLCQIGEEGKLL